MRRRGGSCRTFPSDLPPYPRTTLNFRNNDVALNQPLPTEAPDAEAASVAEAMLTRFVDSWNAADGLAYGEGYWDDAELVGPSGGISSGRHAIAQGHVDGWSGPLKGSRV